MDTSELDRIRERIEQKRRSETGARAAFAGNPSIAECRMGCTFFAGDLVLDLVTGLNGVVESVSRSNVVQSSPQAATPAAGGSLAGLPNSEIIESVIVLLANGHVFARRVRELVKKPAPPAGTK